MDTENVKTHSINFCSILWVTLTTLLVSCGEGSGEDNGQFYGTPVKHSQNVFAEHTNWYINPVWAEHVAGEGYHALSQHSTAIWLNSLADVSPLTDEQIFQLVWPDFLKEPTGGMYLSDHLLEAEKQGNALVQLVLFNLPDRICSHPARSVPKIQADDSGMQIYRDLFIDEIANVLAEFPHVPVAVVLEPLSIVNYMRFWDAKICEDVSNNFSHGYVNGIRYAINTLSKYENVHIYLDVASSAELSSSPDLTMTSLFVHGLLTGFDKLSVTAKNLAYTIEASEGSTGKWENAESVFIEPPPHPDGGTDAPGYSKIDGFATNVTNYVPIEEPFLGDPFIPEGAEPLRSATFYDWGTSFDEHTFSQDWLVALRSHGGDVNGLGVIIDTSRNGWGQSVKNLESEVDLVVQNPERVDDYRLDQRDHRLNWCNQKNAGLGRRPQLDDGESAWIDAYVWIKNPGISDGKSEMYIISDALDQQLKLDTMCDPDEISRPAEQAVSTKGQNITTGALSGAGIEDTWFSAGFQSLVENAWPVLCEGQNDQCD